MAEWKRVGDSNVEGKRYHLGTYDSAAEASEVYEATAMELFGEFYRPV